MSEPSTTAGRAVPATQRCPAHSGLPPSAPCLNESCAEDSFAQPTQALRVLTVNTHKGFSWFNRRFVLPELRQALQAATADLVFLQEVVGADEGSRVRRSKGFTRPHWEYLAETVFGFCAYGRNAVYTHGHHGNAVLSKYPITGYENHDVSVNDERVDIERRGLLHCRIKWPGHSLPLHAICVHLGLREWQRRQQLQSLCGVVNRLVPFDAPLIVAGDFNDWRGRAHRTLQHCTGLDEAFVRLRGSAARSFPARYPLLRLDRVYCRGIHPRRCEVLSQQPWSRLSDHAALCVEMVG